MILEKKSSSNMNKHVKILGVKVHAIPFINVYQKITEFLNSSAQHYLVTCNSEFILAAQTDHEFKKILNHADLSVADGAGLLWAAKYLSLPLPKNIIFKKITAFWQLISSSICFTFNQFYGKSIIPERITGVDLVPEISKICAENKKSLFLLGAGPNVAVTTATRLTALYPNLKIVGTYGGPANVWQPHYDQQIIKKINQAVPDCLLIAFGAPKQECWINRNLPKLRSVRLAAGIGGAFDFISQQKSLLGGKKAVRAPLWMRNMNIEWLHRMFYQPGRFGPIINAVVVFPWKVFLSKTKQ
ncbi:WecB/TagA/CpsF family glycosyltransferase [Patescibacteria group bacterium]|nr:WecB/TagA/CpsF family glycosyltransferase [Patescibacteria group bacterium]